MVRKYNPPHKYRLNGTLPAFFLIVYQGIKLMKYSEVSGFGFGNDRTQR